MGHYLSSHLSIDRMNRWMRGKLSSYSYEFFFVFLMDEIIITYERTSHPSWQNNWNPYRFVTGSISSGMAQTNSVCKKPIRAAFYSETFIVGWMTNPLIWENSLSLSSPLSMAQRIGQRTVKKEEESCGRWMDKHREHGSGHTLMLVMKPWPRHKRDRHEDPTAPWKVEFP